MKEDFNTITVKEENKPTTDNMVTIGDQKYKLDEKGNAIGEDGKIVKTKIELDSIDKKPKDTTSKPEEPEKPKEEKPKEPEDTGNENKGETIEINDTEYSLDDNGNAIDNEGNIVFTKEDIEKAAGESEDSDEDGVDVNTILNEIGIEIKDPEGKYVNYEPTPDGFKQVLKDVYEKGKLDTSNEAIDGLFNEYPVLRDALYYMQLNNTTDLSGYSKDPDYTKLKLDEKNTKQLKDVIYKSRIAKGDTEEEATAFVKYAEDDNKLGDYGKSALDYLKNTQKATKETRERQIQQLRQQEENERKQFAGFEFSENGEIKDLRITGSVYDKVMNKGKLNLGDVEITIPETIKVKLDSGKVRPATRKDFFHYLMIPKQRVINNQRVVMTDYEYDLEVKQQNTTVDNDILEAYKTFTGLSDAEVAQQKELQREVRKIKKLKIKKQSGSTDKNNNNKKGNVVVPFK